MAQSERFANIKTQTDRLFQSLPNIKPNTDESLFATWKTTNNIGTGDGTDGADGKPDISVDIIMRYIIYTVFLGTHTPMDEDPPKSFDQVVEKGIELKYLDKKYEELLTKVQPLNDINDSKYEDDLSIILNLLTGGEETYKQDVKTVVFGVQTIFATKTTMTPDEYNTEMTKFINNTVILNINAVYKKLETEANANPIPREPGQYIYGQGKTIVYYDTNLAVKQNVNLSGSDRTHTEYYELMKQPS
jgi:hypothetical protein